jgi:hypothetical protein
MYRNYTAIVPVCHIEFWFSNYWFLMNINTLERILHELPEMTAFSVDDFLLSSVGGAKIMNHRLRL